MTNVHPVEDPLAFDLYDRLHKALRVAGLDRVEMAEYLDVHRNTIGKWLRGEAQPSRRTLIAWALRCGVPLQWLLTGEVDGGGSPGLPAESRWTAHPQVKAHIRPVLVSSAA